MLPDVLFPDLRLVICGTAPGTVSAQRQAYYAFPGNRFWPTLALVGLVPRQLTPAEYHLLPGFGIGLTDLVKDQSGSDAVLRFAATDRIRLERDILSHRPKYLAFNGKRAAQEYLGLRRVEYGLQSIQISDTRLFVAPSTSGLAVKSWDLSHWHALADLVRALG
ncbi:MAG: mismatch-specific DNA-glycosylase [Gemmatimonadales bacterium]